MNKKGASPAFRLGAIVSGLIVILLLVMLAFSITNISRGHVGVVFNRSGGIEANTLTPGTHFVAFWKQVTEYPVSTETVKIIDAPDTPNKMITKDSKLVGVSSSYSFHMDEKMVSHIFSRFRGMDVQKLEETYLQPLVTKHTQSVTSQYGVFDIFGSKIDEASKAIQAGIQGELGQQGIVLESFSITSVNLDDKTEAAVQAKTTALQQLEKVKIDKEIAAITSDKLRISAKGEADAQILRATGTAASNQKVQVTITPALIEYEKIKKWNGQLPTYQAGGSGTLIQVPLK